MCKMTGLMAVVGHNESSDKWLLPSLKSKKCTSEVISNLASTTSNFIDIRNKINSCLNPANPANPANYSLVYNIVAMGKNTLINIHKI